MDKILARTKFRAGPACFIFIQSEEKLAVWYVYSESFVGA